MGRGNVCTFNECEGLYYLDKDFLSAYRKVTRCNCGHVTGFDYNLDPMTAKQLRDTGIKYDFDGTHADWAYDECESTANWRVMIYTVTEAILKQFKSFERVDMWRSDRRIVLQSGLFEIAVVDGDWCAAWCLQERPDVDDDGSNRVFMRRHYKAYLEAIKRVLIKTWGEAVGYGGAWVSGKCYTEKDVA